MVLRYARARRRRLDAAHCMPAPALAGANARRGVGLAVGGPVRIEMGRGSALVLAQGLDLDYFFAAHIDLHTGTDDDGPAHGDDFGKRIRRNLT